jgi:LIVCS family branched-chain amino acid:cation transporter
MKTSAQIKATIGTGLALFAMFFGAGNIIFPLKVGSFSGEHILFGLLAFVIAGVGVPFLGVFAVSLYEGDYWKFFNRIGKVPAFLVVTFLMLIIGPLFAAPRTEVITYNTLLPALPGMLKNPIVFDVLYFFIIFVFVAKQSRVVDIIGWLFSPIKIISFSLLILVGIYTAMPLVPMHLSATQVFNSSITLGYGTMDLLAAFFFCSVAYKNIVNKCQQINVTSQATLRKMMLFACLIGALLISVIYAGFIFVAASHAQALQNIPTESLITQTANVILGQYGALFVGICVSVACLATGATLAEVTTDYLFNTTFKQKVPRMVCLLMVLGTMVCMSVLGFDGIMKIAGPILEVIYPALILLCVVNIYLKVMPSTFSFKLVNRSVDAEEAPLATAND